MHFGFGPRLVSFGLLVGILLAPGPVRAAGVICGTVRDGLTLAPVARAGVFVRLPSGAYTGFYGATALDGSFCIGDVPAGTYDLEIRVDDYRTAYRRNVVVVDDLTSVDVNVAAASASLLPPLPNPARQAVQFRFRLAHEGPVTIEVLDATGRRVQGWRSAAVTAGEHTMSWDFRDATGVSTPAGRYFVRLVGTDVSLTRPFSRIR